MIIKRELRFSEGFLGSGYVSSQLINPIEKADSMIDEKAPQLAKRPRKRLRDVLEPIKIFLNR